MVPKKSLLLAGAAIALFGATSNAQSQSGKVFARYNKPLKSATLDLATGTITRGPAATNRGAPTIVDFANNDLGGFVGVDTGNGFCEWFDAAVKGSLTGDGTANIDSGNQASDIMNSVVFAYCSAALTANSGGPGGSVKLGFYEGYTLGGPAPTSGVAVFTLTGLPANSASSSFFGGFSCIFIRVFFSPMISFADGNIGYSWKFLDSGTGTNPLGPVLAATWPFLSCTTSCSGVIAVADGQGMQDFIDEYCPPGTLRASFTFGTTSGSFTSMSMHVEEVVDKTATMQTKNSTTNPNPDRLTASPAVIGQNFTAAVTLGLGRTKGTFSWIFYPGFSKVAPPSGIPIAQFTGGLNFGTNKRGRMLLCDLNTTGFSCSGTHSGVSGSTSLNACNVTLPLRLSLVCNEWCAQAVILGNPASGADGGGNARLSAVVNGIIRLRISSAATAASLV
jgi:hypothetical protein